MLCSSSSLMDGIYGASIHAMVVLDSIRARRAAMQPHPKRFLLIPPSSPDSLPSRLFPFPCPPEPPPSPKAPSPSPSPSLLPPTLNEDDCSTGKTSTNPWPAQLKQQLRNQRSSKSGGGGGRWKEK